MIFPNIPIYALVTALVFSDTRPNKHYLEGQGDLVSG